MERPKVESINNSLPGSIVINVVKKLCLKKKKIKKMDHSKTQMGTYIYMYLCIISNTRIVEEANTGWLSVLMSRKKKGLERKGTKREEKEKKNK